MQTVLAPPSGPHAHSAAGPTSRAFSPYTSNGGSIMAIAGADFCVVAGDTRQSEGYNIQTRYKPKVFRLTDRATLACNGFAADAAALVSRIKSRLELYRHAHGSSMPIHAIARMISTILYSKRFFPYYVYNILGGLDEDGKGAVYSFDPVGSYEREFCRAAGAAQSLLQPFLDNQIMFRNQVSTAERTVPVPGTMTLPEVLRIVTDSFTSATERHIEVGDGLELFVVRLTPAQATAQAAAAQGSEGGEKKDGAQPPAQGTDADAAMAGGASAPGAAGVDLSAAPYNAVEALGGEDEQEERATMVIRRELKKD